MLNNNNNCKSSKINASFINACKDVCFQCEYGIIYYDTPNESDDLKTKCIESANDKLMLSIANI